jgi:deoxyhypusine synthase
MSKAQPRPRRALYARREELLQELKDAYVAGKEVRP